MKRLLSSVFLVASVTCASLAAHAENGITHRFAPWMKLISSEDEAMRMMSQGSPAVRVENTNSYPPHTETPEAPVITPRVTIDLINRIYGHENVEPPSVLERTYARRIAGVVTQFGYDQFGLPPDNEKTSKKLGSALPSGAVQDSFVLHSGDRLRVTFRGERQDSKVYSVDSGGQLIVSDMQPVTAAGRTIADLREDVQAQADTLHNTSVFISLEAVQQIHVTVAGHVRQPGQQTLTVFNTVTDAVIAAGGIEKTGTLRRIQLIRDGNTKTIDLYDLLVRAKPTTDWLLRDGDQIMIPTVGPTVAVAGAVKRPGIYEVLSSPVRGQSERLSLDDMLGLGGGVLIPGSNRYMKLGVTRDGLETVTEVGDPLAHVFGNGSILKVESSVAARIGTVELTGETRNAGIYELERTPALSTLISSDKIFGKDIYPLIGVIERHDRKHQTSQLLAFSPLQVAQGRLDRRLRDGDIVRLFSRQQIRFLQEEEDEAETRDDDAADNESAFLDPDPLTDDLKSFLRERSAFIRGAIRRKGAWPVAEGTTLADLAAAAGGLTFEADSDEIEVTSRVPGFGKQDKGRGATKRFNVNFTRNAAKVAIGPGDSVRVKQKFARIVDNSVEISGEVVNPGRYDLSPSDHLSDLIKEAGGLTAQAYPPGAIFSRESERKAETARFRARAQELRAGLAATLAGNKKNDDSAKAEDKIGAVEQLIDQLEHAKPVGRVTVQADPGVLVANPDEDILLEAGDRIIIPRRPLTVRVTGEVQSPASLAFRKDKDATEYIKEAGGFTYNADDDRAFVLYPDGSAQPLHVSMWNQSMTMVPPGSTIVVPRDPKPFDFIQTTRDVSQILTNLAITGIFIDDMRQTN